MSKYNSYYSRAKSGYNSAKKGYSNTVSFWKRVKENFDIVLITAGLLVFMPVVLKVLSTKKEQTEVIIK